MSNVFACKDACACSDVHQVSVYTSGPGRADPQIDFHETYI